MMINNKLIQALTNPHAAKEITFEDEREYYKRQYNIFERIITGEHCLS